VTARFPHLKATYYFVTKTILKVTTRTCPAQTNSDGGYMAANCHSTLLLLGHINMKVTPYWGVVQFCCKWATIKQWHWSFHRHYV